MLPEVTCYEVRRELIRLRASTKLRRLEAICHSQIAVPVNSEAWVKAAEFWAMVRQAGYPTAHPQALDADAILAAVALTITKPGDLATIATTNERHLKQFPDVDAQPWEQIT